MIPIPPPNVTGSLHMGHAPAISTESAVEKILWKTDQKTRQGLGQEALTDIIWKWTRVAFMLDESLSTVVPETFI